MIDKVSMFTDIHFGARNNSEQHNKDNVEFIEWFIQETLNNKSEAVIFLADWFQHRNAINGLTLDYSYTAAKMLNDMNLPIYFLVGNHDLYFRHNRSVFTTNHFEGFNNFKIISEITEYPEFGTNGALFAPYLFHDEYPKLIKYSYLPVWFMHAEFKGFVVTGDTKVLEEGPSHLDFKKIKRVFSGHFHKRQNIDNIHYIGNTFPSSYADANDENRGMAHYTFSTNIIEYNNYPNAPLFISDKVSNLLDNKLKIVKRASLKLLADVDMSLEQITNMREEYTSKYDLREFLLEEPSMNESIINTDMNINGMETETTGMIVKELLSRVEQEKIDPIKLIEEYLNA